VLEERNTITISVLQKTFVLLQLGTRSAYAEHGVHHRVKGVEVSVDVVEDASEFSARDGVDLLKQSERVFT
jgi:hypothetical protein